MSAVENLAGDFGVSGRDQDSDAHLSIDRHGATRDFIDDLGVNPVADEMGLRDLRFAPIGVGRDHNRFGMQLGVGHASAVPVGGRLQSPARPNRILQREVGWPTGALLWSCWCRVDLDSGIWTSRRVSLGDVQPAQNTISTVVRVG